MKVQNYVKRVNDEETGSTGEDVHARSQAYANARKFIVRMQLILKAWR